LAQLCQNFGISGGGGGGLVEPPKPLPLWYAIGQDPVKFEVLTAVKMNITVFYLMALQAFWRVLILIFYSMHFRIENKSAKLLGLQ
jgi:hypothetical protein